MADLRISELYLHETLQLSDLLPIVNANSTRRVTTGTLGTFILASNLPITSSGAVFNGDIFVNGNLNVSSLVSASIIFESGSTIFGNDITDTHTFTGSIFLSGSIAYPEWIDFKLDNEVPPQTGRLWWDPTNGTLDIGVTDEVVVSIGEELIYPYVVNGDSVTLPKGVVVMVDPAIVAQGQRLRVVRAISTGQYRADLIMGVTAQEIEVNQQGYVNWFGQVRNVSISGLQDAGYKDENETWGEGDILYPDPIRPGGLTKIPPTGPNLKSTIAVLTTVNGNNANYLVRPSLGPRVQDINDIQINSLSQGELIMWDTGSNYYKTTTQLSGSYGLTGSLDIQGSVSVSQVLNLPPQNPLPVGTIGDLAVSGSNLYFYNGTWTQIV